MPSRGNDFSPSRRRFFHAAMAASAVGLATDPVGVLAAASAQQDHLELPPAFTGLKALGDRVRPITPEEFHGRIEHAQRLMSESPASPDTPPAKFDALFFSAGTSLYYFTGIRWGLSERLLGLVLPRTGEPVLVVPAFEEGRL